MEIEVWKPIEGYEGNYEVSSFGYIRCNVRQCCEGNRKQSYGFKWKYLN